MVCQEMTDAPRHDRMAALPTQYVVPTGIRAYSAHRSIVRRGTMRSHSI
ncbi:MAG: hypothetical protein OJF49_001540 [Ktedonobacterales bacterium]|nr:MAG: hypothetical protein OJF49_001540 [Ktedonobacterales bacterium]